MSIKTGLRNLHGIHALDDDTVVVSDSERNHVCLYKLYTDAKPIWTYEGITKSTGLSSDEAGFIYIVSAETKRISVLSVECKSVNGLLVSGATLVGFIIPPSYNLADTSFEFIYQLR